ncbi:MAG: phosphatase PAP2 family protein [Massilibacteroides sp.]|nr:phosphatase PAP2 family protein [Massilibacteroides sp.]MDD3061685.1 phosphatase PAP2 family protein [Massilibacteroides sp.]MDD4114397.1 phosphatase PAP2 family protein [Massilibacteroides sp.]MDD4660270.1 phosphatase PAP2 family protein [Massilibacteroides sp.]
MLEKLLHYERDLFFFLNGSDSVYWDHFMWLFSSKQVWYPLAFFILLLLCYKKHWKEVLLILLSIVLVIIFCDQFASHFCKPFFARYRPTFHPDFKNQVDVVFGYRSGKYGFISSHAANAFGFATYMAMLLREKWFSFTIFLWATFNAYTRIYLGVHFISDVVCAAIAGFIFGYLGYKLYKIIRGKLLKSPIKPDALYSKKRKIVISAAIGVTVVLMLIFNEAIVDFLRS